jgi:hypothetical protein
MSRKKYISKGASPLSIDIADNGRLYTFDFKGGIKHPVVKLPIYTTSDPKEQELLENYPGFGVSYVLAEQPAPEVAEEPEDSMTVKRFKIVQEAKEWLNEKHEVPYNLITNKTRVLEKAMELGFLLEFETDNK